MKYLNLIIGFILMASFFSCFKKSNTQPSPNAYYIKAKFNGKEKIFSNLPTGQKTINNGSVTHIALGAVLQNSNSFPTYDIEIWNNTGNISVGEYLESAYSIQSRFAINGTTRHSNFANSINDYKVTITQISSTEILGTFQGTITNNSDNINITNGEFYLPLKD